MKNAYEFYFELKNEIGINDIINFLGLHKGTIKRWEQKKEVPTNYLFDLLTLKNDDNLLSKFIETSNIKEKDQYFTKPEIAKYVYTTGLKILKDNGFNIKNYHFIEPSVGEGNFFKLFPKEKRTGIDIDPKINLKNNDIEKMNYLKFKPKISSNENNFLVIGNPPFGLRGNMALRFINHSNFADAIIMILPPLFDSDGKGVPRKRVKNHKLIFTKNLPINSFIYPNGKEVNVSTIMQVWVKKDKKFEYIKEINIDYNCSNLVKIYSLSNGPNSSSKRNVKMIDKCDVYLPSTCFNGMKAYKSFKELPNNRGYGVVILKQKKEIKSYLMNLNWNNYAFLSTNSALNLRESLIKKAIIDGDYKNE